MVYLIMIHKSDKPLIKSNPHLRDPKERNLQFVTGVLSSTSIEGVTLSRTEIKKSSKSLKRK